MASRIQLGQEKKLPDLNFKIRVYLNFSISSTKSLSLSFGRVCDNDDESKSKRLRKITYRLMGCKTQAEFEKAIADDIAEFKSNVKERIKKYNNASGNNFMSELYTKEMEKEIKRADKKFKEKEVRR